MRSVRCSVLQCVAVCCSVLQSSGRSHEELFVVTCCSVLQCLLQRVAVCCGVCCVLLCVAVCCSVLQCVTVFFNVFLQSKSFCFEKYVLKTTVYCVSFSSVPALLPPISFFLISIRMTILGRNVYPPPCPPCPYTPKPPTTCIIMSRSKITFESQKVTPLIRKLPKPVITATYLLSPPPPSQTNFFISPLFSKQPCRAF